MTVFGLQFTKIVNQDFINRYVLSYFLLIKKKKKKAKHGLKLRWKLLSYNSQNYKRVSHLVPNIFFSSFQHTKHMFAFSVCFVLAGHVRDIFRSSIHTLQDKCDSIK